jgi:hypothetical protein
MFLSIVAFSFLSNLIPNPSINRTLARRLSQALEGGDRLAVSNHAADRSMQLDGAWVADVAQLDYWQVNLSSGVPSPTLCSKLASQFITAQLLYFVSAAVAKNCCLVHGVFLDQAGDAA